MISRILSLLSRILRRLQFTIGSWEQRANRGKSDGVLQKKRVVATTAHDMVTFPDEPYYAEQYWHWLQRAFDEVELPRSEACLDLGCGQGRLTMRLARRFPEAQIRGVDFSPNAIAAARQYTAEQGLANATYEETDIISFLAKQTTASVKVALMTEVVFFFPQWPQALQELQRVLEPGGVIAVAFRPLYYDALNLVRQRIWDRIPLLLASRSGRVYGGDQEMTWQESSEVRTLFEDKLQMKMLHLVGIGCCSGLPFDAHGTVAQPSELAADEQQVLMELELALGPRLPDAGRYMLAIAQKSKLPTR